MTRKNKTILISNVLELSCQRSELLFRVLAKNFQNQIFSYNFTITDRFNIEFLYENNESWAIGILKLWITKLNISLLKFSIPNFWSFKLE